MHTAEGDMDYYSPDEQKCCAEGKRKSHQPHLPCELPAGLAFCLLVFGYLRCNRSSKMVTNEVLESEDGVEDNNGWIIYVRNVFNIERAPEAIKRT